MPGGHGGHVFETLLEVWARRKWMALAVFTFAAAVGVTVARSLPNVYRATATVLVEQGKIAQFGPGELESRLQLIGQEILSRNRLETLIHTFDLYPGWAAPSMEPLVQRARNDIRTEFKVQGGGGGTVSFAISFRGTRPELVARVANALAAAYIEEDQRIRERQTSGAVKVLKGQLDDVGKNLDEQERALGEYQDQHMGELPQQAEANLANLQRLHADLRSTSDERIRSLDRRNDLLRELGAAEAAAGGSVRSPGAAAARLAKLKEDLADLSQRYSEKYPDVIRLKQEVAALEKTVAESEARAAADGSGAPPAAASSTAGYSASRLREAVRDLDGDIQNMKAEETRVRAEIAQRIRQLENAPRRQRTYQEIARDHQTTKELYDSLRKRYEQAALEDPEVGRPSSPFRVLDQAIVPTAPFAPKRLMLLILALVGSLAMAVGTAAAAEWLDTSLHTTDDVRAFTRVPVVAAIPRIVTPGDLRSRRRRFVLATACFLLAVGLVVQTVHGLARTGGGLTSLLSRTRP